MWDFSTIRNGFIAGRVGIYGGELKSMYLDSQEIFDSGFGVGASNFHFF